LDVIVEGARLLEAKAKANADVNADRSTNKNANANKKPPEGGFSFFLLQRTRINGAGHRPCGRVV